MFYPKNDRHCYHRKAFMKKKYLLSISLIILTTFSTTSTNFVTNQSASDAMIETKLTRLYKNKSEAMTLTNNEVAEIALREINSGVEKNKNKYEIRSYSIVKDFDGNEYLYVSYNPFGYSIISLNSLVTVETNPFCKSSPTISTGDYYSPTIGFFKSYKDEYRNIKNGKILSSDDRLSLQDGAKSINKNLLLSKNNAINHKIKLINSLTNLNSNGGGGSGDDKSWDVDVDKEVVTADHEIPYSWFFKYNKTQFSYSDGGSNGICEYIAFLLLAEYNDFFVSKGYFSDEEVNKYITTVNSDSREKSIPVVSDSFANDLFEKNNKKETLNCGDLNNLSNLFLKDKKVKYQNVWAYWLFGNPKDVINNGRPDMLCGHFPDTGNRGNIAHNIVAYGYFDKGPYAGKFLCHYGWANDTQCIVDRGVFSSGYDWSLMDKTDKKEKRYFFDIKGDLKCGKDL